METPLMKEQWKCTTNATGVLSVIMTGTLKTLTSYVDSLATLQLPMPGSMLTLVKDQDRIYWAMLYVMELNRALQNVIIWGGLAIAAIMNGTLEWRAIKVMILIHVHKVWLCIAAVTVSLRYFHWDYQTVRPFLNNSWPILGPCTLYRKHHW